MSQQDVYNVLKKFKYGLTTNEIASIMHREGFTITKSTITVNVSKLVLG